MSRKASTRSAVVEASAGRAAGAGVGLLAGRMPGDALRRAVGFLEEGLIREV